MQPNAPKMYQNTAESRHFLALSSPFSMAYLPEAVARRRCKGTTAAGNLCQAWAIWDDPRQLCTAHGGRTRGKERDRDDPRRYYGEKTRCRPCTCRAYAWPHRPGGGLCRWPLQPEYRRTTPAGEHGCRHPAAKFLEKTWRQEKAREAARKRRLAKACVGGSPT